LKPTSTPSEIKDFAKKMLSISMPSSTSTPEKLEYALRDFQTYLEQYCSRILEEKDSWENAEIQEDFRGVKLKSDGWEEKREVEMMRYNPKFVLRQWVLEELIGKLEDLGIEGIEQGRKELAKVLDVCSLGLSLSSPICVTLISV
jgi:uncharacterized protein YdiU (UPF0061 family)